MFHFFIKSKNPPFSRWIFYLSGLSLAAAGYGALRLRMAKLRRRRIELVYGKAHSPEHIARIVWCVGRADLFGDCVLRSRNEILTGALKTDNGENADGYGYHSREIAGEAHTSVKAIRNTFGNIAGTASASHTGQKLRDLRVEHDGRGNLKNSHRQIGAFVVRLYSRTEGIVIGTGFENAHASLASEKYNALIEHAKTAYLVGSSVSEANLKFYFYKHPYVYLKESGIESNFVNTDIRGDNFRALRPYIYTRLQNLCTRGGDIYGCILKTVLVAAAIKNSVCVYINRIASEFYARARYISVFRHKTSSFQR